MALLTGAGASQRNAKFAKLLVKGNTLICLLLYVGGLGYFYMLASNYLSHGTYFSENALLPGLVYSELKSDTVHYAQRLAAELEHERNDAHRTDTPHVWLQAKMRQIGLETYTQNFTLNYPLGGGHVFTGRNVYGILRAPRIGSTESFVLSAPYRTPDSVQPSVVTSVPLLLAFANHARKQKYWAKDLIFLVTEQEQLGMQAWLDAYHDAQPSQQAPDDNDDSSGRILNAGSLEARAGSIQAAINLELPAFDNAYVDVKIEGLNGHLPNLDLVNVVQRIALKEGIVCGHQQRSRRRRNGAKSAQWTNFRHMVTMVLQQACGVPNGNHGLFGRYGITALTLEGSRDGDDDSATTQRDVAGAAALLKLIEGVARSVNNLLERFHQSFFFYLLVSSDRFVSIGDYMPALAALVGALLVKALVVWLRLGDRDGGTDGAVAVADAGAVVTEDSAPDAKRSDVGRVESDLDLVAVGKLLLLVHVFGALAAYLPVNEPLNRHAYMFGMLTEHFQLGLMSIICTLASLVPCAVELSPVGRHVLQIAGLLELATTLLVVGMLNFSFAFTLAVVIVPPVLFINPAPLQQQPPMEETTAAAAPATATTVPLNSPRLGWFLCGLLNPLVIVYGAVLAVTVYWFPDLGATMWPVRAFWATADAITYGVVDSMVYGNWVFNVVLQILLPIWMCLWAVTITSEPTVEAKEEALPNATTVRDAVKARKPKNTKAKAIK